MSRSKWKGNFIDLSLLNNQTTKKKTWNRDAVISSNLIGKKVFVYNGKFHKAINITREKIGFKFGEFSFTRTLKIRSKEKKLKKKK